jgi:hypothetical protein
MSERSICRGCGELFNSVSMFERHRVGPFAPITKPDTRRCLSPAEMTGKGWLKNAAGYWIREAFGDARNRCQGGPTSGLTAPAPSSATPRRIGRNRPPPAKEVTANG